MLVCALNLSEGRNLELLRSLRAALGSACLDLHADAAHHRSVFTLGGPDVLDAARHLTTLALEQLDLRAHAGVHPRLGIVDVVPFAPVGKPPDAAFDLTEALQARDAFARWAATTLDLPCFLYGPERSLPAIRREAFTTLSPDLGPDQPDPRRGACCVGARPPLVAYNLVLEVDDLQLARRIARAIRAPSIRALGLQVAGGVQVSCNLVEPFAVGPAEVYELVNALTPVRRCELVGLLPETVLRRIPPSDWSKLDVAAERSVEHRLAAAGWPLAG